nr:hypothetical protein [Bacilli bacterium]
MSSEQEEFSSAQEEKPSEQSESSSAQAEASSTLEGVASSQEAAVFILFYPQEYTVPIHKKVSNHAKTAVSANSG